MIASKKSLISLRSQIKNQVGIRHLLWPQVLDYDRFDQRNISLHPSNCYY